MAGLKKWSISSKCPMHLGSHFHSKIHLTNSPRATWHSCEWDPPLNTETPSHFPFYHPLSPKYPKYPPSSLYKPLLLPISHNPINSSISNPHLKLKITLNIQELALPKEILEDSRNKGVVTALYEALNRRDAEKIQAILAPDLEWWFHGPPSDQFLMRLLTGDKDSAADLFRFVPHSVAAFGPTVLAEGCDPTRSIAWVHAWTVTDGIITQVREYFNTSLTVTRIGNTDISPLHCPSVWESSLPDRVGKSVPGLVLAI